MQDENHTKPQLLAKLADAYRQIAEWEAATAELERAKRAVQKAREYAENIVDTVREALLVLDADLRVISASRSFYQTFQVTPAETEGQMLYELGDRQWDIPALRALLERILPDDSSFDDFEVEHDFPNIGHRIMRLHARRVYREGNENHFILLSIEDISARKQAEEELARQEAELRTTLYSIGDAVISTDDLGRVVRMNPVAAQLTGWIETEARGEPLEQVFRIVNEETRQKVENPVSRARDGTERPIADSGAPIFDLGGQIAGVVLVFRDQTKERRAQLAIQKARDFAEQIVETIHEPLLVLDADLRVVSANRAFYRTFQVSPKETEGRLIYDLGNRQWDIPRLRQLLEDILPQNTSFDDFEVVQTFEKIGPRTMLLNARRIYSQAGKVQFILLAIEDVTKYKQAERERSLLLARTRAQARQMQQIIECRKACSYWTVIAGSCWQTRWVKAPWQSWLARRWVRSSPIWGIARWSNYLPPRRSKVYGTN